MHDCRDHRAGALGRRWCVLPCTCILQYACIFYFLLQYRTRTQLTCRRPHRYLTCFFVRRCSRRSAMLILLAVLIVARSLDVLVMIHPCFDVCSLMWWSFAYPVGVFLVVRADSNFWGRELSSHLVHMDTQGHIYIWTPAYSTLRPRGDTETSDELSSPRL